MNVERYSYLWDTSNNPYVLVRLSKHSYLGIVDYSNGYEITIEDDDAYPIVIQKMMESGIPIVERETIEDYPKLPEDTELIEIDPRDLPLSYWENLGISPAEKEKMIEKNPGKWRVFKTYIFNKPEE